MAENPPKPKGRTKREQPSVLGTLPATRGERIGRPRGSDAEGAPKRKRAAPAAAAPRARRAAAKQQAAATKPTPTHAQRTPATHPGPTAVRPGSPPLESHRAPAAPPRRSVSAPTGTELVTTTIRAVGELAQIGLILGGQVLKRAVDRIPKP